MSDLVPEGWERCVIGKKIKFLGGYAFKSLDSVDSGTRWLKIANVGIGKIKWEDRSFLPSNFIKEHPNYVLNQGDCVVALTRPIIRGELKVAKISSFDSPSLLNQRVAKVKFNNTLIDNDFVHSMMRYEKISREIEITIFGTDPPNLSTKQIEEIKFNFPPLPEQQKIAKILTSIDEVIEKTQAQIDKLKDLKTGMMQELLTNGIGNNGKPHTKFKNSPVGRIPAEWDVLSVEDVTTDVTYGLTVRPKYIDEGISLVSGKECKDGWLDFSISNKISKIDFDRLRTRSLPKTDDVIMTKTGTIGRVALVRKEHPSFAISQNVALLTPSKTKIEPEFLELLLTSEIVTEQTRLGISTLSIPDLQLGVLKKFLLPIPSQCEQKEIVNAVNSIKAKIYTVTVLSKGNSALKKALMQDLLTGKVRVNVEPNA